MEGVWYLLGSIVAAIICAAFSFNHFMSKSRINQHPMLANVKVIHNLSSEYPSPKPWIRYLTTLASGT